MEGLSWLDLTKVAITSSVFAAFITAGLGWLKDGRQRKQQRALNAKFDAIDLVSKLDALAAKCFFNYKNFHADWEKDDFSGKTNSCEMPPSLIEHSILGNIDSVIACRIAWLGNEIYLSFDEIHTRWNEYLDARDAYEQSANLVGYFGYEAMQISEELRRKYQLTYQSPKWGMDDLVRTLKQCSEDSKRFFKEGS